jgi:ABC-type amino acid transport substrate-binding protein
MKWFLRLLLAVALWVGAFSAGQLDQLDNIHAVGVLRVAVSDGNPPFSFVDPLSRTIILYDIDFARAIAARHWCPVSACRGNVDRPGRHAAVGEGSLVLTNSTTMAAAALVRQEEAQRQDTWQTTFPRPRYRYSAMDLKLCKPCGKVLSMPS